jgi:cytochrome c nitrite reductase small subunit
LGTSSYTVNLVPPLSRKFLVVLAAIACGMATGLGFFAFDYGEGLSYFSKDPRACANCHVMGAEYDSWQKAGHHQVATCVDCHLPHDFVRKYLAKAENGFWHSKGFTFMDFHEPIMIKPRNASILQESCLRCHEGFVHELVAGSRTSGENALQCVHCHRGAGHGARN